MLIFLSFASDQTEIAETVLLGLRNRGHRVFFSRDDLPPGDSYDAQIVDAIAASDLFIFLISRESVSKGRYTLTELSFARQKWPSPRGRVLPVLVTPTPFEAIPNYLKAVSLLEPQGNIAAETAEAVDRLQVQPYSQSILRFGACGLLTGVLSWLAVIYPPKALQFSFLNLRDVATTPIPGVIFGVLVAGCCYRYRVSDRFLLLTVVVLTIIAWILAWDTTATIASTLMDFQKHTSPAGSTMPQQIERIPFLYAISGLAGGFVGGLITTLGIAVATARFRLLEAWLTTLTVATVAGVLLELTTFGSVGAVAFFASWQAAVIVTIARGLGSPRALV